MVFERKKIYIANPSDEQKDLANVVKKVTESKLPLIGSDLYFFNRPSFYYTLYMTSIIFIMICIIVIIYMTTINAEYLYIPIIMIGIFGIIGGWYYWNNKLIDISQPLYKKSFDSIIIQYKKNNIVVEENLYDTTGATVYHINDSTSVLAVDTFLKRKEKKERMRKDGNIEKLKKIAQSTDDLQELVGKERFKHIMEEASSINNRLKTKSITFVNGHSVSFINVIE